MVADSSVGIATCYRVRRFGDRIPVERDFPYLSRPALLHTPPLIRWVPGYSQRVALTTHPQLAPRFKKEQGIRVLSLCTFMAGYMVNFTFTVARTTSVDMRFDMDLFSTLAKYLRVT